MKRQSRRRQLLVTSYTDFPDQYADLLTRFARDKHITMGPMPKRSALALQFQLHRWFGFLRQAPPDDEYAHSLTAIAKTMQCSRLASLNDPNMVTLDWHLDPVTQFMQQPSAAKEHNNET